MCRGCKAHFSAVKAPGLLITTKTREQFKELDYNEVMKSTGLGFLKDLFTDEGLCRIRTDPSVLASFFILTFPVSVDMQSVNNLGFEGSSFCRAAYYLIFIFICPLQDLKKFKFIFWFGFPAVSLPSQEMNLVGPSRKASESCWGQANFDEIQKTLRNSNEIVSQGFFVLEDGKGMGNSSGVEVKSLLEFGTVLPKGDDLKKIWFGFLDTSTIDGTPSWVLRNYLAFLMLNL
jgi:hypothetical protein